LTTLAEAIQQAVEVLKPVSETHLLDAQVLLAHILGKPRAWILAHPEQQLHPEDEGELERALDELMRGISLPYVIGSWEFYGLVFQLTQDVLIPRPETELLVEKAIGWLNAHPQRRWATDVGTGSGCIAITLAHRVRDLTLTASDISSAAVRLALVNAIRHDVHSRIHFLQADLLPPINRPYDLICANLPYIPTDTLMDLKIFGREPTLALDGGADGLTIIRRLLEECRNQIAPGGCILLEIEASQGSLVRKLAEKLFPTGQIQIWTDLEGRERLLEINMIKQPPYSGY
jgi:release factor glutamine methyltransferase